MNRENLSHVCKHQHMLKKELHLTNSKFYTIFYLKNSMVLSTKSKGNHPLVHNLKVFKDRMGPFNLKEVQVTRYIFRKQYLPPGGNLNVKLQI